MTLDEITTPIRLDLLPAEFSALEKTRKGEDRVEFIRRLIKEAYDRNLAPDTAPDLKSENDCLIRANTELQEKLRAAEAKASMTTQDADELRQRLEDMEKDRQSAQLQISFLSGALDVADAKVEAYELILKSARLVPADNMGKGDC